MKGIFNFIQKFFESLRSNNLELSSQPDFGLLGLSPAIRSQANALVKIALRQLEKKLEEVKAKALEMGLMSVGHEPFPPSEPMEELDASVEAMFRPVKQFVGDQNNSIMEELAVVQQDLEKSREERVRELNLINLPELDEMLLNDKMEAEACHSSMQAQIDLSWQYYNLYEATRLKQLKVLGTVPFKGILDSPIALAIMFLALLISDISVTTYAFDALGLVVGIGYLIAIILALATASSAWLMGNGKADRKRFNFIMGLVLGLVLVTVTTAIRVAGTNAIAHKSNLIPDHTNDMLMLGFNIIVWMLAFLFEANRHLRRPYFEAAEKSDEMLAENARLNDDLTHRIEVDRLRLKHIHDAYESNLIELAISRHELLRQNETELKALLVTMVQMGERLDKEISEYQKLGRKVFTDCFTEGLRHRRPKNGGFNIDIAAILVFTCGLLVGCGPTGDNHLGKAPYVEVWLLVDKTIEPPNQNEVDTDRLNEFLANDVMGLHNGTASKTKVDVYYRDISNLAMPSQELAGSLEAGQPYLAQVRNDRIDSIRIFLDGLEWYMVGKFVKNDGQGTSEINQCLCQSLNKLSASDATKKVLLAHSDFLENADVSFLDLDIENLTDETYEGISSSFSKACYLNDLTGIELIGFYTPTPQNQKKVLAAHKIWKRYLESKGAKVSFVPNF